MKTKFLIALLVSSFAIRHSSFAQGVLTPPGAPAPTMKSLDQIEARTAITNTTTLVTISQPGSYYLTHNLTVSSGSGIVIDVSGVTLDLNGFTISSTAAAAGGYGIGINSALKNITIVNGFIQGSVTNNGSGVYRGGGFDYGISYTGNSPENVMVSKISVSGCLDYGIFLSFHNSTVVESCTAQTIGGYGIYASTIKSSSAMDCGNIAICGDQVSDCRGQCSGSYPGIYALTAQNSYGESDGSKGSEGIQASTALNCYGNGISGDGIDAITALNCYGQSNGGGDGIVADEMNNCEGDSSTGTGLYASYIAIGSTGSSSTGTGMEAFIGNSCYGVVYSSGTAESIIYKYNMP